MSERRSAPFAAARWPRRAPCGTDRDRNVPLRGAAKIAANRRWRRLLRRRLLDEFGAYCGANADGLGCGANGGTPLEFAHRVPSVRKIGVDGQALRRNPAERLAEIRANPLLFMLLCRPCHVALDGPTWGTVRTARGRFYPRRLWVASGAEPPLLDLHLETTDPISRAAPREGRACVACLGRYGPTRRWPRGCAHLGG